MGSEVEVRYRNIKYPRIELRTGKVILILPHGKNPEEVLERHKKWIERKLGFIEECKKEAEGKEPVERSEEEFRTLVLSLVEEFSRELGVKVNKVFFRRMSTRWASCSRKGNLTINRLARFLPSHLIEYIVFHELAHLIERRHTDAFWRVVSRKFPSYPSLERELFAYWFKVWG
ncbi:hypothetical protein DRQ20_04670 [bacterium]|nr:MAG: hypothetical protein DRQ18_05120 [bacterium]RKZ25664.1 MAG: hypothetical protein DRQ20_04670 [bacterium]